MIMLMGRECGHKTLKRHSEGKTVEGRSQHDEYGDAKGMPWCDAQPSASMTGTVDLYPLQSKCLTELRRPNPA